MSSDDKSQMSSLIQENFEDKNIFNQNYEIQKKNYKTSQYLNKYEKTIVISERAQQIAEGAIPLIANPENYENIYEIVMEELRQKKIPFIIKRPLNNSFEYWKLEDLKIL